MKTTLLFITLISFLGICQAQETIDVSVQGISNGVKDSKQQDRDEAIMDAKLKAIERSGVSIQAVTVIENYQMKKDWIEAKAAAVILPGFQIIDIGYGEDGLYHVVLTGKVSSGGSATGESEGDKKFRMAKLLLESDKGRALDLLKEVVEKYGECSSADDALYYLITQQLGNEEANEYFLKLKVYYPDSPFITLVDVRKLEILKNLKFVPIPSGSFVMKSNKDCHRHKVNISSFQLMTNEVSQAQWQIVMGYNPSSFRNVGLPVEQVSWDDCQKFLDELNRVDPGKDYRLPTEAEWEYACRAGTTTDYYNGDSEANLSRVAWYKANSDGKSHPVGQKEPNPWGLYDMLGNVWEWCQDWYGYYGSGLQNDPQGPQTGTCRVLRGGSWGSGSLIACCAYRYYGAPTAVNKNYGFRIARTP
jgi:formylglycine-generating enzyme required for sulfatase activity